MASLFPTLHRREHGTTTFFEDVTRQGVDVTRQSVELERIAS